MEAFEAVFASLGLPLRWFAQTGSTNDDLRAWAREGAPQSATVIAESQTAGRGRLGRIWTSPPGANLTLSTLIRSDLPPRRLPLLALAVAVAAVEACGVDLVVKWPNDLLDRRGRKVAGILMEVEPAGAERHVIVGIGLNVDWAPEGAVALRALGFEGERAVLAAAIVAQVRAWSLVVERSPEQVRAAWLARAGLPRQVRVGTIEGTAIGVDELGALLVETTSGRERILAGDVEMVSGFPRQ